MATTAGLWLIGDALTGLRLESARPVGLPSSSARAGSTTADPSPHVAQGPPYDVAPTPSIAPADATVHHAPERLPAAGRPTRLVVPTLDIDVPVVPIDAPGGVLLPPSDPQMLGWWQGGAVPGAATGGALITGHTVHTGGGAFDHLATLHKGDPVTVRTGNGSIRYAVKRVTVYHKQRLAKHAKQVFSQTVPGRLVLITCDDWTGSVYLSNAVVVASPVR
ncbi:MAG TPA: class F sortase [Nocardioidaceae bacterium]|nr:class F sortase [Nocardioidaceae bacterium]